MALGKSSRSAWILLISMRLGLADYGFSPYARHSAVSACIVQNSLRRAWVDFKPASSSLGLQQLFNLLDELLYPRFKVHWTRTDLSVSKACIGRHICVNAYSECIESCSSRLLGAIASRLVLINEGRPSVQVKLLAVLERF